MVEHYAKIIAGLDAKPILIGHSFGGMIAEKLLGLDLGAAAVAIDAAQIKGVLALPLSALRATLPVLRNPANKHRAASLTVEQFRYGFGNAISADESDALWARWAIPAPGRPLFEAAAANFSPHSPVEVDTGNPDRGPLLLIGGAKDHAVPTAVTRSTFKQYRDSAAVTELVEFPDRGHSLTIDSGWREVAEGVCRGCATRGCDRPDGCRAAGRQRGMELRGASRGPRVHDSRVTGGAVPTHLSPPAGAYVTFAIARMLGRC